MQITINVPDTFGVKCAGEVITFKATDIPTASWEFITMYGFRVCGDRVNGPAAAARKAGAAWLPSDYESARADVVARVLNGTIGESARGTGSGMVLDPVAKEAHGLAKAYMMGVWKRKTGEATISKMYAARDSVRDFFDAKDDRYTWREDAVARFIDDNESKLGFRKDAERIVAKRDAADADDLGL